MRSHKAVVLESLVAAGLGMRAGEGNIPDLKQLRGCKKRHVRGVVKEGIAQASLIHKDRLEACLPGLNGARQAGRTRTDHKQISYAFMSSSQFLVVHISRLGYAVAGTDLEMGLAIPHFPANRNAPAEAEAFPKATWIERT
jgi:hypothetical protein